MHKGQIEKLDHAGNSMASRRFKIKLTHQEYTKLRRAAMLGHFPYKYVMELDTMDVYITLRVQRSTTLEDNRAMVMSKLHQANAGARTPIREELIFVDGR